MSIQLEKKIYEYETQKKIIEWETNKKVFQISFLSKSFSSSVSFLRIFFKTSFLNIFFHVSLLRTQILRTMIILSNSCEKHFKYQNNSIASTFHTTYQYYMYITTHMSCTHRPTYSFHSLLRAYFLNFHISQQHFVPIDK